MGIKKVQKSNGKFSYKVEFYLGRCSKTGKKLREYETFETLRDAKEWESRQKMRASKEVTTSDKLAQRKKLLSVHVESYLAHVHEQSSDNTYMSYKQIMGKWIEPFWGNLSSDHVSDSFLLQYKEYLKKGKCSKSTFNYTLGRLKSWFNYLERQKIIFYNPMSGHKIDKKSKTKTSGIKYHENEEVQAILKSNEGRHHTDFIKLLYYTGIRIAEACALRPQDFNKKSRTLNVANQLQRYSPRPGELSVPGAYELKRTKGVERRVVILVPEIANMIKARIKGMDPNEFIFRPERNRIRPVILNRGERNEAVREMSFVNPHEFSRDIYISYQQRAKLENILSVHGTRHTFAVSYMRNGGDIVGLSKLLGHKSIEVTRIYLEFSPDYLSSLEKFVDFTTQTDGRQEAANLRVVRKQR